MARNDNILEYEGSNFMRQRLILSTISGRPVRIINIRHKDDDPGLKDYELTLLKLLDLMTNGSRVEINETGTRLVYRPGLLSGGPMELDCGTNRPIGYYLETVLYLAPFAKKPIKAKFNGISNMRGDVSVDAIKAGLLPVMKRFILNDEGLDIKITKRGLAPDGGAEVEFTSPICRQVRPIQFSDQGKVKKIRGVAFACKVSPVLANRTMESAKTAMKYFINDIYIYTHHTKGAASGKSPGFGIILTAETTTGVVYSAESTSKPRGDDSEPLTPEDVGQEAAHALFQQIYLGGCVDSGPAQPMAVYFMTLTPQDTSKLVIGPLSKYSVHFMRHIRDFFGLTFKVDKHEKSEDDPESEKIQLTCVGIGFTNINKTLL